MPPEALRKSELEAEFFEKPNLEGHIVPPIFRENTLVLRIQYHEPIDIDPTILREFAEHFSSLEESPSININTDDNRGPQIEIEVSIETYDTSS